MEDFRILGLIHVVDNLVPNGVVDLDLIALEVDHKFFDVGCALVWVLLFHEGPEPLCNPAHGCMLYVSELLVDLIPQYLSEEQNVVIQELIIGKAGNDSVNLVYDDVLQPVLLVEISVQILFHRLALLLMLVHTFLVVFDFLKVNVGYEVFDLLEGVATFFRAS